MSPVARWRLSVLLGAALLGGCGRDESARWVGIEDGRLEFPLPRSMTVSHFMGSPNFQPKGGTGSFSIGERSTNWSPYAATLPDEIRQDLARFPHCTAPDIQQGRLSNGWQAAWADTVCHGHVSAPDVVFDVEGVRYVVSTSGGGPPIAEILEFVGRGRVVPLERRSSPAQDERKDPMREIDQLSGGPQIRRTLALGALSWIGLMFACVFLWRRGVRARIAAAVLCLLYAVFFGRFWAILAVTAYFGMPLFGVPGSAAVGAAFAFMLLAFGAAVLFARLRPPSNTQPPEP